MHAFFRSTLLVASFGAFSAVACGSDPPTTFPLDASNEILGGFAFDTGLQPPAGPVRMSLGVAGEGATTVHVDALVGEGDGGSVLYQVGSGVLKIDASFTLDGRLVVDGIPAVPGYDGDIPGLDDVRIAVVGEAPIAAFALDGTATVDAAIPEVDLPKIPLPGGIPGTLNLKVAAGSSISVALTGTCAGIDGDTATFRSSGVRSGTLKLGAAIEIQIPVAGAKTFDIGTFDVPVPSSNLDFVAEHAAGPVSEPEEGTAVASSKACEANEGTGGAGGGATTGASSVSTSVATTATSTNVSVTATATTSPASSSTGQEVCAFANSCQGATSIPSVEGDRPGPVQITSSTGSRRFKIHLTEGDDSAVANGFGYRALVTNGPADTVFELSVRRGIDGEDDVPCNAAVLTDTGETPEIEETWPDILDHSNAVWLEIEAKIVAGDCDAQYSLLFWGGV